MTQSPSTKFSTVEAALLDFSQSIDQIRQNLYYCDVEFRRPGTRLAIQGIRAGVYVHLAAAIEVYVNSTLAAVIAEINYSSLPLADLKMSLFSIAKSNGFQSLADIKGLKNWARRCEILNDFTSSTTSKLDEAQLPLDGRTIRPEHFSTIWQVFGFRGAALPSPIHALALVNVADSRNDVAHGNEDLKIVAGRKTTTDMLRLLTQVEEIGLHLWSATTEYLTKMDYKR